MMVWCSGSTSCVTCLTSSSSMIASGLRCSHADWSRTPQLYPLTLQGPTLSRQLAAAQHRGSVDGLGTLVPSGVHWCCLVARRKGPRSAPRRRFSVSLDAEDYARLRSIAKRLKPPLSLQYV